MSKTAEACIEKKQSSVAAPLEEEGG